MIVCATQKDHVTKRGGQIEGSDHRQGTTSHEFIIGPRWWWQWAGRDEMAPRRGGIRWTGPRTWLAVENEGEGEVKDDPWFPTWVT